MAAFYADENFPLATVEALRRIGHDVLTALEAGQANQRVSDQAVVEFAAMLSHGWPPIEFRRPRPVMSCRGQG